jgi:hypothetical protein
VMNGSLDWNQSATSQVGSLHQMHPCCPSAPFRSRGVVRPEHQKSTCESLGSCPFDFCREDAVAPGRSASPGDVSRLDQFRLTRWSCRLLLIVMPLRWMNAPHMARSFLRSR